jgi:DNA (cytosine-5)-methyltransferase 1
MLRVLDLFSGIGGFSLGLEATGGFRTAAFCECDPYARRVLAKHWPEVKRYNDVRTLTAARLAADGIAVEVVAGGFPCQDISAAGAGAGLDGERSGLWREMRRIIGECRPRWVIAENVPRLRTLGADEVLGDLETLGYAVWPCVVGAVHAGAPHNRRRVWIVAHADGAGLAQRQPGDAGGARPHGGPDALRSDWWHVEPALGRMAHGVPDRVDRVRCLGNAVVPAVVNAFGRAVLAVESADG